MSGRYHSNLLADIALSDPPLLNSSKEISSSISGEIERNYLKLLNILEKNITLTSSDTSVYTGTAGYAYLFLFLGEKENNPRFIQKGLEIVELSLTRLRRRDLTFLCGDTGPLSIAAVLRLKSGNVDGSKECIATVLSFLPKVLKLESDLPNELLYGRVGYLYSLLFIRKYIPNSVPSLALNQVAEAVISAGESDENTHLMWHWHNKAYLGAAHGISGILYLLLQVVQAVVGAGRCGGNPPLMWEWFDEKYLGAAHGLAGILYILLQVREELDDEHLKLIQRTIDYLIGIRFPSGNLPSSLGSSDDRLVHWCHGAPGFVQVLISAYEVYEKEEYLRAAEECGEVVWQRGLLKKGYGLCHGVAGNAYTFIALFQATCKEIYLHRAVQFARWCATYDQNQERPPDRPFSLMEGLAGTVFFLKDIQDPLHALFPAYSLTPFHNVVK